MGRVGFLLLVLTTAVGVGAVPALAAQSGVPSEAPPTASPLGAAPVLLIMDASGSMNADDGTGRPKIDAARQALLALVDSLPDDAQVGLRAYGHRTPNTDPEVGCADTELLVPVGEGNAEILRDAVQGLQASGFTPIGASLRAALEDLPGVEGRTIVLVSDGIDTCAPPAACETARQILAEGVDLRVEAVGFQVDAAAAAELRCIAEATGGTYRPADSADELAEQLQAQVAVGIPVEGGASPAEAPLIGHGRYVDAVGHPTPRWYAVDLAAGQRVRATATLLPAPDTPELPVGVTLELAAVDVMGVTSCDSDAVDAVGPRTDVLAVRGLQVLGGRVCADPGRYAVGIRLVPPDGIDRDVRAALADLHVPIELDVAVVGAARAEATETPAASSPQPPPAALPGPATRPPTPDRLYVGTFLGSTLVGGLAGIALSRRMGP